MRNVESWDTKVILECAYCGDNCIKDITVERVLGIAKDKKWLVDDMENVVCPDCSAEKQYEMVREAEELLEHEANLKQQMSQEAI